jgi:hypothetical protein
MSFTELFFIFLTGGAVVAFLASGKSSFSDVAIILCIGVLTMFAMMPVFWSDQGGFVLLVATVPFFFASSLGAIIGCILNRKLRKTPK